MRLLIVLLLTGLAYGQNDRLNEGRRLFSGHCAFCHGAKGRGGERGPDISTNNPDNRDDLPGLIRNGLPNRGMPGTRLPNNQAEALVLYLRSLARGVVPFRAPTNSRGPTAAELANPPEGSWPNYNGVPEGNRFSPLRQVNLTNVQKLRIEWMFPIPGSARLEVTPIIFDGVMFITGPNEVYAMNARATTSTLIHYWLWSGRRENSAGTSSSPRTIFSTGMLSRRQWSSMLTGKGSHASCSLKRTATDSFTSLIGPTANCFWPNRS